VIHNITVKSIEFRQWKIYSQFTVWNYWNNITQRSNVTWCTANSTLHYRACD